MLRQEEDGERKTLSERISDRFREGICRVCIYRTADGGCGLRQELDCPIMTRIDAIIDVVQQVDDDHMDPYIEKLRETICSECRMQDEQGRCVMRDHADCALDDYFGLVVEIVEEEIER